MAYIERPVDAGYRIDRIGVVRLGCSGDLACTVSRYDATNAGQKVFGFSIVQRSQGKWRIVAQESAAPDPAMVIP